MFDFLTQFAKGYFQTGDQTNEDFSSSLIDTMKQAAYNASNRGRSYIKYEDYPDLKSGQKVADWIGGDRKGSRAEKIKTFALDPVSNAATTIGRANLKVEDGNVYLLDEYDFSKIDQPYNELGMYGKVRKWAGENFPQEGNKIKINLGREEEVLGVPVKSGDTLGKIAAKYQIPISKLAEFNNIEDVNKIKVGQRIRIPSMADEENVDPIQAAIDEVKKKSEPTKKETKKKKEKLDDVLPAVGIQYTIKKGDTLSKIAKENNISVKELAAKNNIKDVNKIYAGQKIEI